MMFRCRFSAPSAGLSSAASTAAAATFCFLLARRTVRAPRLLESTKAIDWLADFRRDFLSSRVRGRLGDRGESGDGSIAGVRIPFGIDPRLPGTLAAFNARGASKATRLDP